MKQNFDIANDQFLSDAFVVLEYVVLGDYYQLFAYLRKLKEEVAMESERIQKANHLNVKKNTDGIHLYHPKKFFFYKLLQPIMNKERIMALGSICKSYRKISWDFLKTQLLLDDDHELFLKEYKLESFLIDGTSFDCHSARATVEAIKRSRFKKVDIKGQI
ncbi:unnamed protein product [Ambrosiozyma monospora]|uniref:Unnamed protein product n=1 Tax=Ambrosiozyma monospora TaxID=43982 RepID=A0A9W6T117_AMBMO|nr:unnamed protein product [Ambrosiozyma monospora]